MTRGGLSALIVGCALAAGCHTPVGNYFANRGRDFAECWRAEVGTGIGLGGGASVAGIAETGLGGGFRMASWGWRYGVGSWTSGEVWGPPGTGDIYAIVGHWSSGEGYFQGRHGEIWSAAVLPGFVRLEDSKGYRELGDLEWVWWRPSDPDNASARRDARIHAFDTEVHLHLAVVNLSVGFSFGEFVDFLLGWFGLDIAGDDRAWEPAARPDGGAGD